jgi:hypothetical protein
MLPRTTFVSSGVTRASLTSPFDLADPSQLPVIAASLSASEGQDHGESVPGP